jgi:hypothetical protein
MVVTVKDLMSGHIKDYLSKDPLEDTNSVDLDIGNLVAKFINPIDMFRSFTTPNVTGALLQDQLVPAKLPQESRCHAFYRMLGFPAIDADGNLFNLGFPLKDQDQQADINKNISKPLKEAIARREFEAQSRLAVFSSPSADTTIFSLSMAVPGGQRSFAIEPGDLINVDVTPKSIPARTQYINKLYSNLDGSGIKNKFESVSHILAPFITDPVIANNIEPKSGSNSVLVGKPFLDKKDLEFESGKYVSRPGIEFILRIKLREQNLYDSILRSSAIDTVTPLLVKTETGLIEFGVNENDARVLFETGLVDRHTVFELLQTFKGVIKLYYAALKEIEEVSKKIMWIPLPGIAGPESGTEVSTSYIKPVNFLDSWEMERRISGLKVKSLLAKYQVDIGVNDDNSALNYSDFTISEFQNVSAEFDASLAEQESQRNNLEARGSNALKIIELMGGEVSGLGLIDVIAVYLSLWSLDTPTLLDLLDDAAAKRLNSISELQNKDTKNRANKIGNATEAYNKLSTVIADVLSQGDKILADLRGSPKKSGFGNVTANLRNG